MFHYCFCLFRNIWPLVGPNIVRKGGFGLPGGCASSRLDHGLKFYVIQGGCASSRLIHGAFPAIFGRASGQIFRKNIKNGKNAVTPVGSDAAVLLSQQPACWDLVGSWHRGLPARQFFRCAGPKETVKNMILHIFCNFFHMFGP